MAAGIVVGVVLAAFAVVAFGWLAIKSVVEKLDARRAARRVAANPNARTVSELLAEREHEIHALVDRANRAEVARLSVETVTRHDREFDAEIAARATETLPKVPVADMPSPRPPQLSRSRLAQRAAADRAGTR